MTRISNVMAVWFLDRYNTILKMQPKKFRVEYRAYFRGAYTESVFVHAEDVEVTDRAMDTGTIPRWCTGYRVCVGGMYDAIPPNDPFYAEKVWDLQRKMVKDVEK